MTMMYINKRSEFVLWDTLIVYFLSILFLAFSMGFKVLVFRTVVLFDKNHVLNLVKPTVVLKFIEQFKQQFSSVFHEISVYENAYLECSVYMEMYTLTWWKTAKLLVNLLSTHSALGLTEKPLVTGTVRLKSTMRASNLVVTGTGCVGSHRTQPTAIFCWSQLAIVRLTLSPANADAEFTSSIDIAEQNQQFNYNNNNILHCTTTTQTQGMFLPTQLQAA